MTISLQDTQLERTALALGLRSLGVADIDLSEAEQRLQTWLQRQYHGSMHFMAKHGLKRSRPEMLVPGTIRAIVVTLDYLPESQECAWQLLDHPSIAYVSRYALGRDYHKLLRKRLQKLADNISETIAPHGYRVFVDSAPVLEKALAAKAGLGWIGKHSNLLNRHHGSWCFLGVIYTDLPLATTPAVTDHCGSCRRCIDICPTAAIVEPYVVDARRCISYLTIEHEGVIPEEFRAAMGNRIYGCDDCQLVCPWNRYAQLSVESDFAPRHELDQANLLDLLNWDEQTFLQRTEGSAIRRIGHERWQRNIIIALGNGERSDKIIQCLQALREHSSELLIEHIDWSLQRLQRA